MTLTTIIIIIGLGTAALGLISLMLLRRHHPHTFIGVVQLGAGRGEEVGLHTANFKLELAHGLKRGLYRCRVIVGAETHQGLLYYGYNSLTQKDCLEAHLFDWRDDLYGRELVVTTTKYLRSERRFASVEQLRRRLAKDLEQASKG